ncbi:MAG TPA: hypothetical protein PLD47_01840 [Aggregatilineales bacterium]|nr:hypothetical protein [Anaerolineales bacterium]HRE46440.1 hypothetical protein [Aggregatilineales bacterium]
MKTPDTLGYMILGYVLAAVILSGYIASLILRARQLQRDSRLVEQLEAEAKNEGR